MIGADQLRALGPDGVLINVGRGPLVDERALYDALRDGDDPRRGDRRLVPLPAGPGERAAPASCRSRSLPTC